MLIIIGTHNLFLIMVVSSLVLMKQALRISPFAWTLHFYDFLNNIIRTTVNNNSATLIFFVNANTPVIDSSWHYYIYFKYIFFLKNWNVTRFYIKLYKRDIVSSQRLTHNWLYVHNTKHEQEVVLLLYTLDSLFTPSSRSFENGLFVVRVRGFGSPPTRTKIHYFCCACRTNHTRT